MNAERPLITEADRQLYFRALDEFGQIGASNTRCDVCGDLITITAAGQTAWAVSCTCGKFNDTLRGL